jgi:hypothetical protein
VSITLILHLSDLHRSPSDLILNSELIAALRSDRASRWPEAVRRDPDIVVLNGDLIQGVPLGEPNFGQSLDDQYDVAFEFAEEVADTFLEGDRSRLIIVPGNHDVDWNTARRAMESATSDDLARISDLPAASLHPESRLRWSWASREFFKITSLDIYQQRFERFLTRRRAFYNDVRPGPLRLDNDLLFIEYPDYDLSITGLSSWYGNDCFCSVGAVDPALLALAQDAVANSSSQLHIAVWHHSTSGGPTQQDFLDVGCIQRLMDYGFRVGLHGHHHRTAVNVMTLRLPTEEQMAIVSTGSVAAGRWALPLGVGRQYNLIDLQPAKRQLRVYIREAVTDLIFVAAQRAELGGEQHLDLTWSPTPAFAPRVSVVALDDAFSAYAEKDFRKVLEILEEHQLDGDAARKLRIETLVALDEHAELIELLNDPKSADELMILVASHSSLGATAATREHVLHVAANLGLATALRDELALRLKLAEVGDE